MHPAFNSETRYKILIILLMYMIFILTIYNHVLVILAIYHAPLPFSSLTMIDKTMNQIVERLTFNQSKVIRASLDLFCKCCEVPV